MSADVTLHPETDGTYAVLARGRTPEIELALRRAGFGWCLGFDPKDAADRAELERRIAEHVGPFSVAWLI